MWLWCQEKRGLKGTRRIAGSQTHLVSQFRADVDPLKETTMMAALGSTATKPWMSVKLPLIFPVVLVGEILEREQIVVLERGDCYCPVGLDSRARISRASNGLANGIVTVAVCRRCILGVELESREV